ncbi:hypothetical protein SMD44_07774 [Streptomyces alboflavus]|uniref:Uncharacterized protein n=1 Tax=Streptomyces alboflavus TaxID=67267 RepID=A0A1Z1WPC5_9ACTN|nr:hypothetical protein SMD44_07774 [Streptomyces alboflavus]
MPAQVSSWSSRFLHKPTWSRADRALSPTCKTTRRAPDPRAATTALKKAAQPSLTQACSAGPDLHQPTQVEAGQTVAGGDRADHTTIDRV